MSLPSYSIVIPTLDLPEELDRTLGSIRQQTHPPAVTIVVDASRDSRSRQVAERWAQEMPVRYERSDERSAAVQRNLGGMLVDPETSPLVAFIDDDITLYPDTGSGVCRVFDDDSHEEIGGVAARIDEIHRMPPSGLSWAYYRIQAGYSDATYGGRLFGPAINCLPCYLAEDRDLIPAGWLNSGCVFYRTQLFQKEQFPEFEGYSFMEDVHLSARIARTHHLFFHKTARCSHRDGAVHRGASDAAALARSRMKNQRVVAREVLGMGGWPLEAKLLLHRIFVTLSLLRRSDHQRWRELLGTWT